MLDPLFIIQKILQKEHITGEEIQIMIYAHWVGFRKELQ